MDAEYILIIGAILSLIITIYNCIRSIKKGVLSRFLAVTGLSCMLLLFLAAYVYPLYMCKDQKSYGCGFGYLLLGLTYAFYILFIIQLFYFFWLKKVSKPDNPS